MGIYSVKPKFQKLLTPVTNFFVRYRVHPTTINIWGFILSIAAGICLYLSSKDSQFLIAVPFLVFIRTALNALDGLVSRSLGLASSFGEVLNEFLDRLSDVAIFLGLALASFSGFLLGSLTIVAILLNSYVGVLSKAAGGSRQYVGIMGKADRMLYVGLAAIIVFVTNNQAVWIYFWWVVLIGTLITLIQRFISTKKELEHAGR